MYLDRVVKGWQGCEHIHEDFTMQRTLNISQLSEYLGFKSRKTLYLMIEDGRFPVKPVEGLKPRRWNVEDVDAWRLRGGVQ